LLDEIKFPFIKKCALISTDEIHIQITILLPVVTQILNVICLSSLDLGDRKSPGIEKLFMQGKKVKMQKCRPCHTFTKGIQSVSNISDKYYSNTLLEILL
jgi:hypothetical protein